MWIFSHKENTDFFSTFIWQFTRLTLNLRQIF